MSLFYKIQRANYDYLTFLSGVCECQNIEEINNELKAQDNYCENLEFYKTHIEELTVDTTESGRLDFGYSITGLKKDQTSENLTVHVQQYCGEEIDDELRGEEYDDAVKKYQDSIDSLLIDVGTCVISYTPVGPEMELALNTTDTIGGLIGAINDIKEADNEVKKKNYELMTEWNQDGILVTGFNGEKKLKTGLYDPETVYKWNVLQRDGLSVMCVDDKDITTGINSINRFSADNFDDNMTGNDWEAYSLEDKKNVLLCLWTGETSDTKISDLSNEQFSDAIKCLQANLPSGIKYEDTAVGKTFSEKLSNWEAY